MTEKQTEKDTRIITGDGNIASGEGVSEIKQTETHFYGVVTGPVHTGSGNIHIASASPVDELESQFEALKSRQASWKEYSRLFKTIANYFLRSLPSELDEKMILTVERMLNDLDHRAYEEGWDKNLGDAISEALALSSELSYTAKQRYGSPYKADFFKTAKRLGKILDLITALF